MGLLRSIAASLGMLTALGSGPAAAAALETDVDVRMPSVVVLSCYDSIDVDVTPDALLAAVGHTGGSVSLSTDAIARPGRLLVRAPRSQFRRGDWRARRYVNLKLPNICAYRAIGQNRRGVLVSVAERNTVLENGGGSQITVSNLRARDTARAGGWRGSYRVRSSDLGWGSTRGIDVRMRLDLLKARMAGTYSSNAAGTFDVTVVLSP